jgi:uncharacterized protein
MTPDDDCDDLGQRALVERLRALLGAACADSGEIIETHISRVLLVGELAYKLKRPVDLGFLDFSTLAARQHYATEEVRLNRRLAERLYLDVVPVTGTPAAPRLGGDENAGILDYAVRMRRFPQDALLTRQPLTDGLTDALAERIAAFHAAIPEAPPDGPYGAPEQVLAPMLENFAVIRASVELDPALDADLERLESWTRRQWVALKGVLAARRRDGFIRECHGDLHRGNIAVLDGEPLIFDCIEFSPALRWIDTQSELAFLLMDLKQAGEVRAARRLLNRWLMRSGDYAGLALLGFYLVYRALVRAKVTAIGAAQHHQGHAAPDVALRGYVRQALLDSRASSPRLVLLCGLSGSGKTYLAERLAEQVALIHLRSDVERKRLFGLPPEARGDAQLYSEQASTRTYARLLALADGLLRAGCGVLVDATFLTAARRGPFFALAERLGCPLDILALDAPPAVLRARVRARHRAGTDPSDADVAVLEQQLAGREPLGPAERARALFVDTRGVLPLEDLARLLS